MLTETMVTNPVELSIGGMTCSGCVKAVTKALSQVPGVTGVNVDLANQRARVEGNAKMPSLIVAIEQAGFEVKVPAHLESKPVRKNGGCGCGC